MNHNAPKHSPPARDHAARGFTIIEMLMSILILGLLISLLIVGVRRARSTVQNTVDQGTVHSVMMGVIEFKKQFGFVPPIVQELPVTPPAIRTIRLGPPLPFPGTAYRVNRLRVYDIGVPADFAFLQNDPPPSPSDPNPFSDDRRYSITSLPIYLAGALKYPYFATGPSGTVVPMDGVDGPGFYPPKRDGTFDVPSEIASPPPSGASRRGSPIAPLVNLGGGSLKLITLDRDPPSVMLVDRTGTPIRYYRWEHKNGTPPDALKDLHVPIIVARDPALYPGTPLDRDITKNTQVRNATFAIVAAGNNKLFGDEPLADLRAALSNSGASEEELRRIAEADNIVEVGQ